MMLSKIFQLAPETAYTPKYPKAWKTPGACFKCGEEGHCACVWTRPHKPLQLCAMCHQEGCWTTDYPHAPQVIRASNPEAPTANLLGLTMDNWGDPGSFGLTTTIFREPCVVITVSRYSILFLLDAGATCSVMMELQRPNSSCFPTDILTRLTKLKHYRLTHSLLVIPSCPIPFPGRALLAKTGASISFVPNICFTPASPVVLPKLQIPWYTFSLNNDGSPGMECPKSLCSQTPSSSHSMAGQSCLLASYPNHHLSLITSWLLCCTVFTSTTFAHIPSTCLKLILIPYLPQSTLELGPLHSSWSQPPSSFSRSLQSYPYYSTAAKINGLPRWIQLESHVKLLLEVNPPFYISTPQGRLLLSLKRYQGWVACLWSQ